MIRSTAIAGPARWTRGRFTAALVTLVLVAAMLVTTLGTRAAAATDPCAVPTSVACENTKPGTPQSTWDVSGSGSATIQGFATQMSVNVGETEIFKVKTTATSYRLDIYRMGYYGGNGARLIASVNPSRRSRRPSRTA